uniref:Uncharacterized protein n=1 Tax=Anguilla anguilla TaxID=7936 RepID=A0A0E9SPD3_ANGAN
MMSEWLHCAILGNKSISINSYSSLGMLIMAVMWRAY